MFGLGIDVVTTLTNDSDEALPQRAFQVYSNLLTGLLPVMSVYEEHVEGEGAWYQIVNARFVIDTEEVEAEPAVADDPTESKTNYWITIIVPPHTTYHAVRRA